MGLAAGPWYTSATYSAIVATASVLAAVVLGVLGFYFLRIPLRRRLVFSTETKPLIADPSGAVKDSQLEVVYAGKSIPTPHLITFSLTNKSRTDIKRDDFEGEPLAFDFGTRVALLNATAPGGQRLARDWYRVDGSRILIDPRLIKPGDSATARLLTETPPQIGWQNTLAGVNLREKRYANVKRRWVAAAVLLIAANFTTGLLSHFLTSSGKPASTPPTVSRTGLPDMAFISLQAGQQPIEATTRILTEPGNGGVSTVAYSPDSSYLAAGGGDGNFRIWNAATGKLLYDKHDPNSLGVYAVAFSPDGKLFATGDGNGYVYVWPMTFKQPVALPDNSSVRSVAFSPDSRFVAAGGMNGIVYVWNLRTHQVELQNDPGKREIAAIAFSPGNDYLVAGDTSGHMFRWAHTLQGDKHPSDSVAVRALAFSKDGNYLAVGDLNASTYIWSTASWTVVSTPNYGYSCGTNGVAFSPDSKYLATADCDGHLYLWNDMLSGTPSVPAAQSATSDFQETGGLTAVDFSPDGNRLAAGSSNGYLYEWSAHF